MKFVPSVILMFFNYAHFAYQDKKYQTKRNILAARINKLYCGPNGPTASIFYGI